MASHVTVTRRNDGSSSTTSSSSSSAMTASDCSTAATVATAVLMPLSVAPSAAAAVAPEVCTKNGAKICTWRRFLTRQFGWATEQIGNCCCSVVMCSEM
jgi:hypothetical protein